MSVVKPLPFCYAIVQQAALAAAGVVQPNFAIGNDADFYLTEIRESIVKIAAWTTGGLSMQIQLQQGELFSNGAINLLSFASGTMPPTEGKPIRFDNPIMIPRNSTIQVQLTNNDAAAVASVQVQFWGYKVE